jgi:hypothetical protein
MSTNLLRLGAPGALLAGVAWIVAGIIDVMTTSFTPLEEALILVALLGTLGGLTGLHFQQARSYGRLESFLSRQGRNYGWLGAIGFLAAFIGSTLMLIGLAISLSGNGTALGLAFPNLALGIGLPGTFAGYVLLGIATLRLKLLPQWCGLALIVCLPVAVALGEYGGGIVIGLTWLGLGYALLSQGSRSALF